MALDCFLIAWVVAALVLTPILCRFLAGASEPLDD